MPLQQHELIALLDGGVTARDIYGEHPSRSYPNMPWGSENFYISACTADLLIGMNGGEKIWSQDQNISFVLDEIIPRHLRLGQCGKEWRSGIYLHYFLDCFRCLRYIGHKVGRADLKKACDNWLRVCYFQTALFSLPVPHKSYRGATPPRGPKLFTFDGPYVDGAYSSADCGFRSHSDYPELILRNFSPSQLEEIIPPDGGPSRPITALGKCLHRKGYWDWDSIFTQHQREVMYKAMRNDVAALREVLSYITVYPSYKPYELVRTTGGVATVLNVFGDPSNPGRPSSTQPTQAKKVMNDGTTYVISCGTGIRGSGDSDWIMPSVGDIDWGLRKIKCQRYDWDYTLNMDLPDGDILFHVQWDQNGCREGRTAPPIPLPPTSPLPPPVKKKRKSIWDKFIEWLKGLF